MRIPIKQAQKCPNCGSSDIRKIVYGYPGPGLADDIAANRIVRGGCVIMGGDPNWQCAACNRKW
jgi:hypothetical protein